MKFLKYLILLLIIIPVNIKADTFEINSSHAILYNMNENEVIFEKNADERTYIASLTKIMTSIVAIENIDDVDQKVTIPYQALEGLIEANASVAGFKLNQTVTYRDLLYGSLLPSGADATRALAYYIIGSEEEFVNLMNEKAEELGLTNTHFANTSGLDTNNHYSTVREMSIILKYALQNPLFKEIYTSNTYTTSDGSLTFKSVFSNYLNRFNLQNKYIYGSKTGYTTLAGYCLSSIANYDGVEYMLITTNADGESDRPLHIIDAFTIYDYYTSNYRYLTIVDSDDTIVTLDTVNSKQKQLEIKANQTISKYLKTTINKKDFKFQYNGLEEISYFTKKGEIGTVDILLNDEIIDTISVVYEGGLSFSIISFFTDNILIILLVTIVLISLVRFKNKMKKKKLRQKRS